MCPAAGPVALRKQQTRPPYMASADLRTVAARPPQAHSGQTNPATLCFCSQRQQAACLTMPRSSGVRLSHPTLKMGSRKAHGHSVRGPVHSRAPDPQVPEGLYKATFQTLCRADLNPTESVTEGRAQELAQSPAPRPRALGLRVADFKALSGTGAGLN